MATTFTCIYLGTSSARIDPTEGNNTAENAGALVGQSYGSAGDPLFTQITSTTMVDKGGAKGVLDQNNSASNDQFTADLGAGTTTLTYDAAAIYNATITYSDGTTATVTAVVAQDTTGNLFLVPEITANSDTTAYQAKPIQSITLHSVNTDTGTGLATNRDASGFDDGYVDGTTGNDLIDGRYIEPIANGTDKVDGNDAGLAGSNGNDDHIRAGAGNDTVYANLGADSVYGGDGADNVYGGSGNDSLYGEAGADTLAGGDGNDALFGGADNDYLSGEAGADSLAGDGGNDLIYGGAGADTLSGGDGNDSLWGDADNDSLSGGAGADSVTGGDGDDTLSGGSGADTLSGGAGSDRFQFDQAGGGDRISDFDMTLTLGQTADQLDVSDLQNPDGSPVKAFDVVVGNDGSGNALLTFPSGETVVLQGVSPALAAGNLPAMGIPCFAAGTLIRTPDGSRRVEDVRPGDLVATRDGAAKVLWHGARELNAADLNDAPHLRPIRIAAGVLGNDRVLTVSPQHGILLRQGGREVLVAARHLAGAVPGVRVAQGCRRVSYHHLLLPRHAILWAGGAECESFYPGPMALRGLNGADILPLVAALLALPVAGPVVGPGGSLAQRYGARVRPVLTRRAAMDWLGGPALRPRGRLCAS